jgi:hypothetical protein
LGTRRCTDGWWNTLPNGGPKSPTDVPSPDAPCCAPASTERSYRLPSGTRCSEEGVTALIGCPGIFLCKRGNE